MVDADDNNVRLFEQNYPTRCTRTPLINAASLMAFFIWLQLSMYFSSQYPFLMLVDPTSTDSFYGLIIGMKSLCQIVSVLLNGWLSDRIGKFRLLLFILTSLMISGNLLYSQAKAFPEVMAVIGGVKITRGYVLLIARALIGMGSATPTLLRTYVVAASHPRDRADAMAKLGMATTLASVVAPGFQLLFSPLGYPGVEVLPDVWLSIYTAPAYIGMGMNVICFLIIIFVLEEFEDQPSGAKCPPPPPTPVAVVNLTTAAKDYVIANIETISAPLVAAIFALTHHQLVIYLSAAHALSGLVSLVVYVALRGKRIKEENQ